MCRCKASGPLPWSLSNLCKGFVIDIEGEMFTIHQQSAHDIRRHYVCKDVARMQVSANRTGHGAAVLVLTNEPAYRLRRSRAETADAAFDIAKPRELAGMLQWSALAGQGTIRGRETPLQLTGRYPLAWRDYSVLGGTAATFRYLWIPVPAP